MKLKKLLASAVAAALAVTTMAVTSFTASAADEFTVINNYQCSNGDFSGLDYKEAVKAVVNLTFPADSNQYTNGKIYANSGAGWKDTGTDVGLGSETNQATAGTPIDVTVEFNGGSAIGDQSAVWEGFQVGFNQYGGSGATINKVTIYGDSDTELGSITPGTTMISSKSITKTATGTVNAIVVTMKYGTGTDTYWNGQIGVSGTGAGGDDGYVAAKFEASSNASPDATITNKIGTTSTEVTIPLTDGSGDYTIQIDEYGWGSLTVESIEFTSAAAPETPTVTLSPTTASVAVGETTEITMTAANADGYTFTAASSDATKATVTETATANKFTVTGVAAGSATITVTGSKSGEDDITATCAVTVTAAGVTPPPSGEATTLWSGTQAMAADWSASVQIEAAELSSLTAGGKLKVTYEAGADAQLSLKHKGDEWPGLPGFVAGDGGEWAAYNITGNGSYEYTLTAEDVALLKANGLAVSGKNYTLTKIEYIPAGGSGGDDEHTHTPASEWSHDGTNHWHACTGCDEKLDLAAHTYVSGSCSVCGAADPNAGSNPTPTPSPSPSVPSTAPNPAPVQQTTVVDTILATPDGSSSSVNLGASTKLDRVTVEAIATKGDVTIKFTVAGGAYWEINGKNITDAKGVDLGVRVNSKQIPESKVEAFAGEKTSIQLTLSHNGSLGFTGTLNVPVGNAHNGKYANLYYYHGGKFDFVGSSAISGGRTQFAFDHASNYLIVIDDYAYGEDVSSASGMTETTETSAVPYAAALVVIAAFGASAIVLKKRLSK